MIIVGSIARNRSDAEIGRGVRRADGGDGL
jgi:hypothetical protein